MNRLAWSALLLVTLSTPTWARCSRTCASQPDGCAKGFGTLAYVVTTCQVVGGSQIGAQELRIHRSGCDPITVLRLANPEPVSDPAGLCALVGRNHLGTASPVAGVFHRLGVTPNGKGVVFEITNAFQLVGRTALTDAQQGFFYVRADGRGLRRLGPPSRDPTYRLFLTGGQPAADVTARLPIADDNRTAGFTDLAPGTDGVDTEQLFTMDLVTGQRRQVTHLTAGTPPGRGRHAIYYFEFYGHKTIVFVHLLGDTGETKLIQVDGTGLRPQEVPPGISPGGQVIPTVRRGGLRYSVYGVPFPGPPANADVLPDFGAGQELFSLIAGRHPIQLTNFHYGDTIAIGLRPRDVLFMASADPLGENPFHNCELFRISPLGRGLRQLTHFDVGRRSEEGCQLGVLLGCAIKHVDQSNYYASVANPFYSDCDPFGTNPNGSQVFIMRANGSGFRQITQTRGATTAADGSVLEVEIPGPVAYDGPG